MKAKRKLPEIKSEKHLACIYYDLNDQSWTKEDKFYETRKELIRLLSPYFEDK